MTHNPYTAVPQFRRYSQKQLIIKIFTFQSILITTYPAECLQITMGEFWELQNYGCKVVSRQAFGPTGFQYLKVHRLQWLDPKGKQRVWEYVSSRSSNGLPAVTAVAIYARIHSKSGNQSPLIPVVTQFRPPLNSVTLELPAGLIDEGETASEAAVRELQEETGLVGTVVDVSQTVSHTPAKSAGLYRVVTVDVDGDLPQNKNPVQQLDDGEFIRVEYVAENKLFDYIKRMHEKKGYHTVGYLYGLAAGLSLNSKKTTEYDANQSGDQVLKKQDIIMDRGIELDDIIGKTNRMAIDQQTVQERAGIGKLVGVGGIGAVVGSLITMLIMKTRS
eukprot:TRINITY_DN6364_c0_g1_i2.p1 TRINITY_DN6364_c0_g1~~TRINITY_DN6364_c0_g1_i2.p1  ORF type:complete len:332 (+),score=30.10 TRINITY_DN6364_c0_g1_i2:749-1744(+)